MCETTPDPVLAASSINAFGFFTGALALGARPSVPTLATRLATAISLSPVPTSQSSEKSVVRSEASPTPGMKPPPILPKNAPAARFPPTLSTR
jgi:hypothetical protein